MTAALTLPLAVLETMSEVRWHRANGVPMLSRAGTLAYMKARPFRFALSLVVSVLPEIVGVLGKMREARRARARARARVGTT